MHIYRSRRCVMHIKTDCVLCSAQICAVNQNSMDNLGIEARVLTEVAKCLNEIYTERFWKVLVCILSYIACNAPDITST